MAEAGGVGVATAGDSLATIAHAQAPRRGAPNAFVPGYVTYRPDAP